MGRAARRRSPWGIVVAVVQVDVYSDIVCPWCFVGRRRLARAVELLGDRHELQVTWKPFQLNAWIPPEGMDRAEYRKAKFGSAERSSSMDGRLQAIGQEEGIALNFDKIKRTPNTFDAHRLIWLGEQQGRQIEVVDALFRAYFQDGKDVGDHAVLVELAAEAGLDAEEARRFLASTDGVSDVDEEESVGRSLGIDGVPFFLFAGKYGVSGAQPAEVLVDVIQQVVDLEQAAERELVGVATGATCEVDDPTCK
jgi:predicted DsbA family dithiol-disulfide isomerase